MGTNNTYVALPNNDLPFPLAAAICLAISFYIVIIILGLIIRKCLISHGICTGCCPKIKNNPDCCESCKVCAQQCNWKLPTVDNCLDSICPTKQRVNCIEFLVCDWASMQCCNEGGTYTCGSGDYSCTCEAPQCDSINCICCEISFRTTAPSHA